MNSKRCFTELAALSLTLIGHIFCLVSLFIPYWLTLPSGMLVNEGYRLGLWQTCVIQDVGLSVCHGHQTLLGLPLHILLGRVLVCLSVICGAFGFLISAPALSCVKCLDEHEQYVRRIFIVIGGTLFILAGALTICFVSYFAYDVFIKFWDPSIPKDTPRFEFGISMFLGWVGGLLLLLGGGVLLVSQFWSSRNKTPLRCSNPTSFTIKSV
ncbi:hypothetical protein GDO86_002989 [Hymenochirus boettgeri]|uniref:Claudin n=1 Tax=Hymenochirus boettgeri TaxID=247094 RepID=A0A8T2K7N4_9PIPI|nr:hypothetical protein GDO86_002989 [Hymenochirus boettgeri]